MKFLFYDRSMKNHLTQYEEVGFTNFKTRTDF